MTLKAKEVIDRARTILQDAGADYWEADELPKWLTDARQRAYQLRPDLYKVTEPLAVKAGSQQQVPGGARLLFDVPRNLSAPSGRQITLVSEAELARVRPAWRSMPQADEILHFLYDPKRGDEFEVYPPAVADTQVEIVYAKPPAAIDSPDSEIDLTEEGEYGAALADWILYRAFLKEADTVPAFQQRAAQHAAAFQAELTGAVAAKAATSPSDS